jgi:hypothetical protein
MAITALAGPLSQSAARVLVAAFILAAVIRRSGSAIVDGVYVS